MRKPLNILAAAALVISLFAGTVSYSAEAPKMGENGYVFRGYAQINDEFKEDSEILTDKTTVLDKGTVVKMVVANIINTENNVRGDEFFAQITNEIKTEDGVVVPAGSVAHGTIIEIVNSKRFSRDANVTLNFDYIVTPDGREIPIEARMTTKRNPVANAAKVTATHAGYTLGGGALGGLLALQMFGLPAAVASQGYTVIGGAGVGGAVGLAVAMSKKGNEVLLAQGDEINVKLTEKTKLRVMKESALLDNEFFNENLDVRITNITYEKDPFGEPNTITLTLSIVNKTDRQLSTFDMALMNDTKAVFHASPFSDTDLWFKKLSPNSRMAGKISFNIENPKQKLWFVFFDGKNRKMLLKISLDNVKRTLEKERETGKKARK
ncbi:MAG: hypothetical protein PHX18_01220 [Candidatus Gastranaerophilales bacterium]|nr:hypothetical protein [Candidatus Gastranaerophilales bacterium]